MGRNEAGQSDSPKVGIQWPLDSGGRTTGVAKEVWCAAATAAGGDNGLAEEIRSEKNWRFGYINHVAKLAKITAASDNETAQSIAAAGLNQLLQNFVFIKNDNSSEDGATTSISLAELAATPYAGPGKGKFSIKKISGSGNIPTTINFPYKKDVMDDAKLKNKMQEWVERGSCEPDCAKKVSKVLPPTVPNPLPESYKAKVGPLKIVNNSFDIMIIVLYRHNSQDMLLRRVLSRL